MLPVRCLIAGSILLLANTESPKFAKYKPVESYEITPEILIMPTYSVNGDVCQIGVEKRLYSPERVSVDPILPRRTIEQIFDELVPLQDRGPRVKDFGDNLTIEGGQTATTTIGYKNVVLEIFSERVPGSTKSKIIVGDIAAVIQWRNRNCK